MAPDDEHYVALTYISAFAKMLDARSILDVGSGLGRCATYLRQELPTAKVVEVEPSRSLIEQGERPRPVIQGSGYSLPFADDAFDLTVAAGVLHHVPDADKVVREMARVSRLGVFISDRNRFGYGSLTARLAKLVLYRAGLWEVVVKARTGGRGAFFSEEDGVFYSYSIFDTFPRLRPWGQTFVIPIVSTHDRGPLLLTTPHGLLCSISHEGTRS